MNDLLFAHSETAHHTKEPGALRNIAVHGTGDHQHTGKQHQSKQHARHAVHRPERSAVALSGRTHHIQIFMHGILAILLL